MPLLCQLVPRQRKASAAVELIRQTTTDLIRKCKEMVDEEEMAAASQAEDYMNEADPSVLRWGAGARGRCRAVAGLAQGLGRAWGICLPAACRCSCGRLMYHIELLDTVPLPSACQRNHCTAAQATTVQPVPPVCTRAP